MRKIIHIDMDAFFASVEELDNPALKGKPLVVGGSPEGRGVVSAASYESRRYGIHSAMPCAKAKRLCPDAIFVKPRMERYVEISAKIREIFHRYTDLVEPLSIDEAFLDVTENKVDNPSATLIALEIKKSIKEELGLTASAGVSYNKFLAKVASDVDKPDGITVITPKKAEKFLEQLPIGRFYGIGKVTEKRMLDLGIRTGKDLKERDRKDLIEFFGKAGSLYYDLVRGKDNRPVTTHRERKSIGKERTFQVDLEGIEEMAEHLEKIAQRVEKSMAKRSVRGHTVTLKVRYDDFTSITRNRTLPNAVYKASETLPVVLELLKNSTEAETRKVRLLGISISNFHIEKYEQLELPFEDKLRNS